MKIAIGCDHIVTNLKNKIVQKLIENDFIVYDCGTHDHQRTHYPMYGHAVGSLVAQKMVDFGIVICGTGVGIANAANKTKNVRCVLTQSPLLAKKARIDYDANVLAMGGEIINIGLMWKIIETFLHTSYYHKNNKIVQTINNKIIHENYSSQLFNEQIHKWNCGCYENVDEKNITTGQYVHNLESVNIKILNKSSYEKN